MSLSDPPEIRIRPGTGVNRDNDSDLIAEKTKMLLKLLREKVIVTVFLKTSLVLVELK